MPQLLQTKNILFIICLTFFSCIAFGQPKVGPVPQPNATTNDNNEIDSRPSIEIAIAKRDEKALISFADDIYQHFDLQTSQRDIVWISRICSGLRDCPATELTIQELNQRNKRRCEYATAALRVSLKNAMEIPLKTEIDLLHNLSTHTIGSSRPAMPKNEILQYRDEFISYWNHAWNRINKSIDPDFDASRAIQEPVQVPGGKYPGGIKPKLIKDPKVRAEYEELLAQHKKLRSYYNEQLLLRDMKRDFIRDFKCFAVASYSYPTTDFEGLKKYLTELKDEELSKAVLEQWEKTVKPVPKPQ